MTPADVARTLGRSVSAVLDEEDEVFRVYFESHLPATLEPYGGSIDLKELVFTKERMESTPWYKVYQSVLLETLLPRIERRYDRIAADPEGPTSFGDSELKHARVEVNLEILRELPNATGVPSALTMLDTLFSEVDAVAKAKAQLGGGRARERAMTIYPDLAIGGEAGGRGEPSGRGSAVYRLTSVKGHAVFVGRCGGIMVFRRQDDGIPADELYPFGKYVEEHSASLLVDKPSGKDGRNIQGLEQS